MNNAKNLIQQLLPTLYEDDDLVAVEKPPGIDVRALRPGCATGLVELLTELRRGDESLCLTNRLSRYESGVLILAKNPAAAQKIRADLKRQHVKQEYVAVVLGRSAQGRLVVGTAFDSLGQQRQRHQTAIRPRRLSRSRSGSDRNSPTSGRKVDGRTIISAVETRAGRTLVHCRTTVENTHELRAQLRAVRLRLLGDKLHEPQWRSKFESRTCLHLAKVSFRHPTHDGTTVVSSPEPGAFSRIAAGESDVERPLHAALVRRLPLIMRRETNAYRLLTGDAEDVRGLVVERFGPVAILQIHADRPALRRPLAAVAQWYCRTLGLEAVYAKRFVRDRTSASPEVRAELHAAKPLVGKEVPAQVEVNERGMRFLIRPYDGFSTGLFLDQRENRSRIRGMAGAKDVLNLFAYTGGFSVAAAAGGARSVTSVDLSSNHLDWGKKNFEQNGLDWASYHWVRSDAQDYLKRAKRQSRHFDLIILDPPTFSHGQKSGRRFSIERDLAGLVAGAVDLLRPAGTILLSTNNRRMTLQGLRDRLREGAGGRRYRITATPPLPPDFGSAPETSKSLIVRFS